MHFLPPPSSSPPSPMESGDATPYVSCLHEVAGDIPSHTGCRTQSESRGYVVQLQREVTDTVPCDSYSAERW